MVVLLFNIFSSMFIVFTLELFTRSQLLLKTCVGPYNQSSLILTQALKQTTGDPSGQKWNYRGITLLYNFTTALLYVMSSVTMARIVSMLLNIY